jgi:hypothetical protein
MAHHGLGILAFSIVNYRDMQYDEDEQDTLVRATTVTTEDIRKSKTAKIVAPLANMGGLLHLLNQYQIFTTLLWNRESRWAQHVSALHWELSESQRRVGNDPKALSRVTREATWALTSEASAFFCQTMSKSELQWEDLEFSKSCLGDLIGGLARGIPQCIAGLPLEWERQSKLPAKQRGSSQKRDEPLIGGGGHKDAQNRNNKQNKLGLSTITKPLFLESPPSSRSF